MLFVDGFPSRTTKFSNTLTRNTDGKKSCTGYPACIATAASWDRELAYRIGAAIGRDCRARGIHLLLGPGVNIYRFPLCGRNFEYLGEDPQLASEMATAYIRGVQDQGVVATSARDIKGCASLTVVDV